MKDSIDQMREPLPGSSRLDEMLTDYADEAAEYAEGVEGTWGWVEDRYVDCRGCGFPLAIGQYHIQTMSLRESCTRCGFSCYYPLQSCVPSIIAENDAGSDMEAFLATGSCASIVCSECGGNAFVFLDPRRDSFSLMACCPTCWHQERSREDALPPRPRPMIEPAAEEEVSTDDPSSLL